MLPKIFQKRRVVDVKCFKCILLYFYQIICDKDVVENEWKKLSGEKGKVRRQSRNCLKKKKA
jgi:hypothetical protein